MKATPTGLMLPSSKKMKPQNVDRFSAYSKEALKSVSLRINASLAGVLVFNQNKVKQVHDHFSDELKIGEYDFIKVINYCRTKKFTEAPSKAALEGELKAEWAKDEFYKPVLSDDPFLMHQWTKDEDFMSSGDNKNIERNGFPVSFLLFFILIITQLYKP